MPNRIQTQATAKTTSTVLPSRTSLTRGADPVQEERQPDIATQRASAARLGHSFGAIGVTAARPPAIQRKLTVGAPGDKYEDEADKGASDAIQRQTMRAESEAQQENQTGLPDHLKAGIETLSGIALDDVSVHYGSSKPAAVQALAYTQGTEIHVAPGQEQHLAHEAWHVVQQKQGRVQPTLQMKGVEINDDRGLEHEADVMGERALRRQGGTLDTMTLTHTVSQSDPEAAVQMVRMPIAPPANPVTLALLEQAIRDCDTQIQELDKQEGEYGFIKLEDIRRWRNHYDQRILGLRGLNPGDTAYSSEDIEAQSTQMLKAFRSVLVSLALLRNALNTSHKDFTAWKYEQETQAEEEPEYEDKYAEKNDPQKKLERERAKKRQEQAEHAKLRKLGLGDKWGKHRDALKYKSQTTFTQYVPEGAQTIVACLKSQNILDAVYHKDKAFWLADPKQFALGSANGKVLMVYTFSSEGAKSLMEDYLICGSEDYDDDNAEPWTGETGHPYYTIWKTNELGAYGVGAARLVELAGKVTKIEAYNADDKKIEIQK